VPVDVSEEVLPSPGVLEGGGKQAVQLVVIGVKGVYLVVKVVSEPIQLVFLLIEVVLSLLDGFELGQVLLVIHYYA
jgi:hypothetical protein